MIRSENAPRTAWIFVDIAVAISVATSPRRGGSSSGCCRPPPGYTLVFSGQFEFWEKTLPRLVAASVMALVAIIFLLYVSSRSWFPLAW